MAVGGRGYPGSIVRSSASTTKKTIEVDYSGIAISIIYALKKTRLDPNKDVYDIGLPNWQGKNDKRRPMIKKRRLMRLLMMKKAITIYQALL